MTTEKPLTRKDVLRLIKENSGKAEGLDLSNHKFVEAIDLSGLDLTGIILNNAMFPPKLEFADLQANMQPGQLPVVKKIIGAKLREVNLSSAHLQRAGLSHSDLRDANLYGARMQGAFFAKTNLQGANLCAASLEGTTFRGANLQGACFLSTDIPPTVNFEKVNWGNYILWDEKRARNPVSYINAAETYRNLKIWHINTGKYDIAGKFFYREMESLRKALKWCPNPLPRIRHALYWLLCGYGEMPWRVVVSAATVVLGLALMYWGIGTLTPNTFLNSLYYSAVSFTALGYGSWAPEPTGWVKGLGAFEAFIGVFMMALFLVTFIRKMTR